MTTPIPEAAVEAAREALSEHLTSDIQIDYCCADIALTAARPHMEAEIRGQVAPGPHVHDATCVLDCPVKQAARDGRAATITERTQR